MQPIFICQVKGDSDSGGVAPSSYCAYLMVLRSVSFESLTINPKYCRRMGYQRERIAYMTDICGRMKSILKTNQTVEASTSGMARVIKYCEDIPRYVYSGPLKAQIVDLVHPKFVSLQNYLGDSFTLPPKHIVANAVVPLAWLDDELIAERKVGLTEYLNRLNTVALYQNNEAFLQFLSPFDHNCISTRGFVDAPDMVSCTTATLGRVSVVPKTASVAAAYYPAWSAGRNPPEKLQFAKFDILFFAFAIPNASSTLDWDTGSQGILKELVSSARRSGEGTKIVLSVGGWGGSHWFSDVMKTAASRARFNNTLVSVVDTFGLDGIDIDWEYPNSAGAGNRHHATDSVNFLSFLRLLRASLGPSKIISAAVAHLPWLGSNGKPMPNVAEFAAIMTYVNIMNYDVNASSTTPGPNAPLDCGKPTGDNCKTSKKPQSNAHSAFMYWTKAGFPASKLLLGLALYGYVSKSTATKLSGSSARDPSATPSGHPRNYLSLAPAGDLSAMWGQQIAFNQLVHSGVLQRRGDGTYTAAHGYSQARTTVITYDDTWSIAAKVKFAKSAGMGGCFTWSLDQDDDLALQDVILANLGKV
ncbi:hypothetical protein DXG01_011077 [Tephrocybe rancida]|nr:hypothetical protein DXG01_011077 [Tephrocybe rancida]